MTEQIWCETDFPSEHLYDTSILQNEDKLYYFKRINKKLNGQSQPTYGEEDIYSYLRLYKFDFNSRKESPVQNTQDFVIDEMIISPEDQKLDVTCFNITFADKFGHPKSNKKLNELQFLRQQ